MYENGSKTLARKKSSLSVMFKQLYRDELIEKNITDGFDPIRVPEGRRTRDQGAAGRRGHADAGRGLNRRASYGEGTSVLGEDQEEETRRYLILFHNVRSAGCSSCSSSMCRHSTSHRGEFKIYRKRDKEAVMPLNNSVTEAVKDYIENERANDDTISWTSIKTRFFFLFRAGA